MDFCPRRPLKVAMVSRPMQDSTTLRVLVHFQIVRFPSGDRRYYVLWLRDPPNFGIHIRPRGIHA